MPHKRPCIDLKIKFAKLLDECEKVAKEGQGCEPFTDSAHHMCAIALWKKERVAVTSYLWRPTD